MTFVKDLEREKKWIERYGRTEDMCVCVFVCDREENERGTYVCVWFRNRKREKREEPTSVCVCVYIK